ncbi:MAG: FtsX-like permease family protein [Chitinispirillaceae bacterium]|nr:FtsX-like permease family protein [Chitinispirillaceae bacterium]
MNLMIKIAWRNIMRHRGKSLVIGVILFVGAFLMTIGNGVISGMDRGLQKNIVNSFTGDIVLVSEKQESDEVFIEMMGKTVEPINNFKQVDSLLKTVDDLQKWVPIGKNGALVLNEEGGAPGFTFLIGVDFERYQKVFPNTMKAVEGRLFNPGEHGVLVPTGARKQMFEVSNIWFIPEGCGVDTTSMFKEAKEMRSNLVSKQSIVFMGMGADNTSTDIRLGIKGIVRYNALNQIWGHFGIVDIESYRNCIGYIAAADKASLVLSDADKKLLGGEDTDLDNLFSVDGMITENVFAPPRSSTKTSTAPKAATGPSLADAIQTDLDDGTYNLVLVLLNDHSKLDEKVKAVNQRLKASGVGVRAVPWKKAIGAIGSMAVLIKSALFVFVMFLFFVAIIIIVNTLSMAALERTSEIGMMRAVGARKGFISTMFFGETAILSFFFGGLGIVTGYVTVRVLALCKFTSDNDMVQLLFGGDTFHPLLSGGDILLAVIQLTIVTLIAVIYPMQVARSITPLDAIARE